jgi:hypothetical protein
MNRAGKIVLLASVILLAVLAVSLSPANIARATCYPEIWVAPPPLGNDANPGTSPAQPVEYIQTGIDRVCGDGTVHVAAGTYYENIHIGSAQNLVGDGAPTTIIDGSHCCDGCGAVINISSAPSENTISGFTIQGGNVAVAGIWEPGKDNVLYAGLKLPSFRTASSHFTTDGEGCGGGIYIGYTHTVTLNDCTIKNNEAIDGGGICNHGRLYMNRCTVSGNTAFEWGGGIYNSPYCAPDTGKMWLTNCTISGNSATGLLVHNNHAPIFGTAIVNAGLISGDGGGIFNAGDMELLNCTIANNYAAGYGGGFANIVFDTATFKNTIVANNTAGEPGTNNGYNPPPGLIISLGHNLDSENTCHFDQPTDLINTDPLLGPLQDNGGPTFTHALPEGSPAVDAGDNVGAPPTDQRGVTRPQGTYVDIGAYELVQTQEPTVTQENPSYSPPMPNINRYLNPASLSVQFVRVAPQQATANQPVTVSTNVVNTGDQSGNLNVELKINGQVEQTRMVSVGPQASQPIKFTVTRAQPGTYTVAILDHSGSFTILGAEGTTGAPVNVGLIVILVIGVLIIASVMVLLLSRRPA